MKKIKFLLFLAFALPMVGIAQDCAGYFPLKPGTLYETSSYNEKDKLQSVVSTTIQSSEKITNGYHYEATAVIKNDKGKEESTMTYGLDCRENQIVIDMRSMMNTQQMESMKNMEVSMESSDLVLPSQLSVGTELPDAHFQMKGSMNGMTIMNLNNRIFNRKVTSSEKITTPAGTFDCMVVEEDSEVKMMGMDIVVHTKNWYSLGIGCVRTESYRKGKLDGYSVMTKFQQ